jgi:predicted nucleic-acid-binding protein
MRSLDTNILLRFILADLPEQYAAANTLFADGKEKFVVADIVFAEIVWILQGPVYKMDRDLIAAAIKSCLKVNQINCNRMMLESALDRFVAYPKISFIDACLATYAELNEDTPLLTFDKQLAKALPELTSELK